MKKQNPNFELTYFRDSNKFWRFLKSDIANLADNIYTVSNFNVSKKSEYFKGVCKAGISGILLSSLAFFDTPPVLEGSISMISTYFLLDNLSDSFNYVKTYLD